MSVVSPVIKVYDSSTNVNNNSNLENSVTKNTINNNDRIIRATTTTYTTSNIIKNTPV